MAFSIRKYTTKGLLIGKLEAEAETTVNGFTLLDLFEDYTHVEENINNGCFIISGRKGSGKSAYAVWLKQKSLSSSQMYTEIIKKDEFATEEIIQASPEKDLKYEALFEWLILVRLVKMILDTKIGTYLKEIKSLNDFYKKNAGYIDIDQYAIVEIIHNKEVNFSPLKKEFGWFSKLLGNKSIKAPFYQMISPLRETLKDILKMEVFDGYQFFVIFDDLDVKFDLKNKQDRDSIMDLIRVVRRYMTDYFNGLNIKVLVLLRDDIKDSLVGTDSDVSKIFGSYEHQINWYEHVNRENETSIMLRRFINRRIRKSFDMLRIPYNSNDPWLSFVDESQKDKTTQFKYILDFTFYLPRDLISIFKDIHNKDYRLPLSHADINNLLKVYSKTKASEIRDELAVFFGNDNMVIDRIFGVLEEVNNGWDVKYEQVMDILKKFNFDQSVFSLLIDRSLLVPVEISTGHLFFNYREKEFEGDFSKYTYRTPKVLTKYFQSL